MHVAELGIHDSVKSALASVSSCKVVQRHSFVPFELVLWGIISPERCFLFSFPCLCHDLYELWQLYLAC